MAERPPPPKLSDAPLAPGLYVVSTPIGNLRDITLRALDVLAQADLVLAEDTRVTGKLLSAYGLKRPLRRYDDHAGAQARPQILEELAGGARIALASDAGTPLMSDPGYRLVREAAAQGTPVFAVPGASSILAALTVAGLATDRFLFVGFPPGKAAARRRFFAELRSEPSTLVLFEGASRLGESLADAAAALGPREAAVARELTKLHETVRRGALTDLAADPELRAPKGEVVVVIGPPPPEAARPADVEAALREALARTGPSEAAAEVARALGQPRRELYRRALELKGDEA